MPGPLGSLFDPNTEAAAKAYAASLPLAQSTTPGVQFAAPGALGALYQPDPNEGMTHTPGPPPLPLEQRAAIAALAAPFVHTIGGLYNAATSLPALGRQLANEPIMTSDPSGMISDTGSISGANTMGAVNAAAALGAGGYVAPKEAGSLGMWGADAQSYLDKSIKAHAAVAAGSDSATEAAIHGELASKLQAMKDNGPSYLPAASEQPVVDGALTSYMTKLAEKQNVLPAVASAPTAGGIKGMGLAKSPSWLSQFDKFADDDLPEVPATTYNFADALSALQAKIGLPETWSPAAQNVLNDAIAYHTAAGGVAHNNIANFVKDMKAIGPSYQPPADLVWGSHGSSGMVDVKDSVDAYLADAVAAHESLPGSVPRGPVDLSQHVQPIDWQTYTPPRGAATLPPVDDAAARAQALGYNTSVPLFKGMGWHAEPGAGLGELGGFADPATKPHERAIFAADDPKVSQGYAHSYNLAPMYARADNAFAVNWPDIAPSHTIASCRSSSTMLAGWVPTR